MKGTTTSSYGGRARSTCFSALLLLVASLAHNTFHTGHDITGPQTNPFGIQSPAPGEPNSPDNQFPSCPACASQKQTLAIVVLSTLSLEPYPSGCHSIEIQPAFEKTSHHELDLSRAPPLRG